MERVKVVFSWILILVSGMAALILAAIIAKIFSLKILIIMCGVFIAISIIIAANLFYWEHTDAKYKRQV
ncbi:hypothetical protein [Staphylococcus pseudintermedius]|uniref:hypothetical protein n=1 Tax=Staphylococcus pseudintermedius TaxID=283734 RepID=UPI00101FE881|nr:hypothetical protein [Staphylococcus pseudintermedius]RYS18568.1 hypothetical protein DLS46_13260 [Staphylococcus pseudintermedius]